MPGAQPPWEPQNYDNRFDGPMPLRQALYKSVNIIAIKLGMEIGEEAVIAEATRFGMVASPIPPVPSIHLGSAVVKPLELIAAYTAFANKGERATPDGHPPGRGPPGEHPLAAPAPAGAGHGPAAAPGS